MIKLSVRDRDGVRRDFIAGADATLMEALRGAGFDVAGTCGGMCSCGTCHVHVADKDLARLQPASEDERDMIAALAEVVAVKPGSRLACQLRICPALNGISIEIAPQP